MLTFVAVIAITVIASSQASVSQHNPFYCFATDPIKPQSTMFSTKVAYEAARGNFDFNTFRSSCTPRKFFMFSRHGSRLPSSGVTRRMLDIHESLRTQVIDNYNAGRTQLCRQDFENIQNWRINPNISVERNSELVETGWNELRGLAGRFQAAYPTILPSTYVRSQFLFRGTDRQRTVASLQGFAEGLFGANGWQNIQFENISDPDLLIRPHDGCSLYDETSDNFREMDAFEDGPEFQELVEQVNRKLGFVGGNRLTSREVRTVWDFCTFEQGWTPSSSPWCAAFSIANNAVLDYFEDLDYYWNMGYGESVQLHANMNCHIMQELLRYLESNDPNDQLARLYSSHSRALQLFLVTLGVFNEDQTLTRHNFAQQTLRQWRSSFIAPMASNFVVIRSDCADGDNDLLILYNERPLNIPGCGPHGLCKQSVFVNRYRRFLNANCAELFCSNNA